MKVEAKPGTVSSYISSMLGIRHRLSHCYGTYSYQLMAWSLRV